MNGIIVLKKEEGISSQGAVSRVKRLFGAKKAGHTGTLDPMATGVLPILLGRAVKASEYMLTSDKYYLAELLLGEVTDTADVTGTVIAQSDDIPSEEKVIAAVSSFLGEGQQIPPMYSAIKIGGKKLCDLAREGKTVDRAPRDITIHEIKAEKISERVYSLYVHCSKGTYIRTLCEDIGKKLGCGATMKALCRLRSSVFSLEDAFTLSELEAMDERERAEKIIPTERVFRHLSAVTLDDFFARLAACGQPIYLKKIGISLPQGENVTLWNKNGFFALGLVDDEQGEAVIRPIKQFDISEG